MRELMGALEGACIHMMVETAPEETRIREQVDVASGGRLTLHESRNMIHPQDLPFAIEDAPELFTNFRLKIEKEWVVRPELPPPSPQEPRPLTVPLGDLPTIEELTGEPPPDGPPRFRGGESAALARLEEYFWRSDRLGVY
ncbi:MAG: cryptochrome DASH, partial [Armatimonadota bacterium]